MKGHVLCLQGKVYARKIGWVGTKVKLSFPVFRRS